MSIEQANRLKDLDIAISRLEDAHVHLPFTLKEKTGTIGAPIGGYRVYNDGKRNVLLFAFSTELFNDASWPDNREEVAEQLYVVDAYSDKEGLGWVEKAAIKHQRQLEDKMFQDLNIYDLGNNFYANKKVCYKITEVKGKTPESPSKWVLRFKPEGLSSLDDEEDLTPTNFFERAMSNSLLIDGPYDSQEDAYERMRKHFSRRVDNIWRTGGPIRMSERIRKPKIMIKEFGGASRRYLTKTPAKVLMVDLGIVTSTALGHVFGGLGHLAGEVAEILHNYRSFHHEGHGKSVANRFVSSAHKRKLWARVARAMVPYHYDAQHDQTALGRCVDPKKLPSLSVLSGDKIPFKTARTLGIVNADKSWPVKWLMRAFQFKYSAIVKSDNCGLVTLDTRTGITVHHVVGENRAFLEMQKGRTKESLSEINDIRIRDLFTDDHVTEIKYDPIYGFRSENITPEEFSKRALQVTNNKSWETSSASGRPDMNNTDHQRMKVLRRMITYSKTLKDNDVTVSATELSRLKKILTSLEKGVKRREFVGPATPEGFIKTNPTETRLAKPLFVEAEEKKEQTQRKPSARHRQP